MGRPEQHLLRRRWLLIATVLALWGAPLGSHPSVSFGSGDPIWVTVQAMAPVMPGHLDVARHDAVAAALQKAVDEVVAAKISVDALLVQLKLSGYIMGAIPHARIVEQQMISESQRPCDADDTSKSAICHWVQLKAAVAEVSAGMDPQFQIAATLNKRFFKDGDSMQIQLLATDDCYGYIFVLLESGQVMRLLPNRYSRGNHLKANQPLVFPGAKDAARGVRLVAHGLDDRPATQEAFYCLALKAPLDHGALDKIQEGLFQQYGQRDTFLRELIRQVVRIPLDKRADTLVPYQIVRAE